MIEAEKQFKMALEIDGNLIRSKQNLVFLYKRMGKYK